MGIITSLPCCTERSRGDSSTTAPGSSARKVSVVVSKLGTLDEFTETVRQLASNQKLPSENMNFQHPWATKPVTVAAQAAVNLAARIRKSKDPVVRDSYHKAGCIAPLMKFLLDATEIDKVHASLLALQSITDACTNQAILDDLVQLDALLILPKLMSSTSQVEGARMASASIARNIIGSNQKYKTEFISNGGGRALVSLLDFNSSRVRDEQFMQWILERVNDVRDYVESARGQLDDNTAKKLVSENIKSKLMVLKSSSQDNDIIEDSIDVLNLLQKY